MRRKKMKINEITINDKELVFETLKSNVATTVAQNFREYKQLTNNFSSYPQDVYTIDEIAEILYTLKEQLNNADGIFDHNDQTIKLITALLNYFNTGI